MKNRGSKRRVRTALGAMAVVLLGGRSILAEQPPSMPMFMLQVVDANETPVAETQPAADAKATASKYWLGLQCEPASEAVRDQLELQQDEGLVVVRVMPGAPAAKADIRPHDLLLKAGDKKLTAVADLSAAVDAAKEEPLKLKLLRGGKPIERSVRPALRPTNPQANLLQPGSDRETVERWLKQFGVDAPGAWGNGMTFVHPGAGLMLPPGVTVRPELPDDMSVDIHREGKKAAEITVKKGKQTWKATEDDLSKLPEDIRREVEPLLRDGPIRIWFRELRSPSTPGAATPAHPQNSERDGSTLNRQDNPRQQTSDKDFDDLSRRLEEMQQTLQELRQREQRRHQ